MTAELVGAVALGGLAGAPARYLVDRAVTDRSETELPIGTMVVNLSGSLIFGLLSGLGLGHHIGPVPLALFGSGFCGAYTTFSTFAMEALRLLEDGELRQAAVTVGAGTVGGLLAAGAGVAIGLAA